MPSNDEADDRGQAAGPLRLRPLNFEDIRSLREQEDLINPGPRASWRHSLIQRDLESYGAQLWAGVLEQQMIEWQPSAKPLGLVVAYDWAPNAGTVSIAVAGMRRSSGVFVLGGVALFLERLFNRYPLRIARAEADAQSLSRFHSLDRYGFKRSATLHRYVRTAQDSYIDWHVYELHRQDFETQMQPAIDAYRQRSARRRPKHRE